MGLGVWLLCYQVYNRFINYGLKTVDIKWFRVFVLSKGVLKKGLVYIKLLKAG